MKVTLQNVVDEVLRDLGMVWERLSRDREEIKTLAGRVALLEECNSTAKLVKDLRAEIEGVRQDARNAAVWPLR